MPRRFAQNRRLLSCPGHGSSIRRSSSDRQFTSERRKGTRGDTVRGRGTGRVRFGSDVECGLTVYRDEGFLKSVFALRGLRPVFVQGLPDDPEEACESQKNGRTERNEGAQR